MALPLLATNNVSSAGTPGESDSVLAASITAPDDLLQAAAAWTDQQEANRQRDLELAMQLGREAEAQSAEASRAQAKAAADLAAARKLADAKARAAAEAKAQAAKQAADAQAAKVAAELARQKAAQKAAEDKARQIAGIQVGSPSQPGDPSPEWFARLRECESHGNYGAISGGGGFYRGAYQFSQSTWDTVARSAYPALVGVDPAQATPAQQDAMALALYRIGGRSQWPICGA